MCRLTTVDSRQRSWRRGTGQTTDETQRSGQPVSTRVETRGACNFMWRRACSYQTCPLLAGQPRPEEISGAERERAREPAAAREQTSSNRRNAMRSRITFMMFGPIDRRDRIVHGVPSRPAIHRTYAALASESDDLSPGRVGSRRQRVTQTRSRGFGGTGQARAARRDPTCFTFYTACKPREQATLGNTRPQTR